MRYASRKARADVRRRVKGRFVKAGDAYDYDPLNETRSFWFRNVTPYILGNKGSILNWAKLIEVLCGWMKERYVLWCNGIVLQCPIKEAGWEKQNPLLLHQSPTYQPEKRNDEHANLLLSKRAAENGTWPFLEVHDQLHSRRVQTSHLVCNYCVCWLHHVFIESPKIIYHMSFHVWRTHSSLAIMLCCHV